MENLKKLMGSAYKEGITVEEINAFLGSHKVVDLSLGGYVDKDKYDRAVNDKSALQTKYDELSEKTKDYDTLKTENDGFKAEKSDNELKAKLKGYGVSEKSFKYVKGDITDKVLTLGDDDKANKEAVAKYLKEHPQFAESGGSFRKIVTKPVHNNNDGEGEGSQDANKTINDNIRAALGKKVEVEG